MVRINQVLVLSGLAGASVTLFLGFLWAPSVSSEAFKSPLAQKIFYWHVPSAWAAMLAFTMLFIGSTAWFFLGRIGVGIFMWRVLKVGLFLD